MSGDTTRVATRYDEMFESLEARREGAFVPFVVLGDPTPAISLEIVRALVEAGADALELGIPFSDPVADGPTIQAAAVRALEGGVTPEHCWDLLATIRGRYPRLPVGLLVYANLVANDGLPAFYARAAQVGVDSVLVADVPTLEAAPFVESALAHGVAPVLIAPPGADEERLRSIARLAQGYTYVVSRAGVTGAETEAGASHCDLVETLHSLGAPPCMVGFGISRPEHVREALQLGARGAISGSAVVGRIADSLEDEPRMLGSLADFVRDMKAATRLGG